MSGRLSAHHSCASRRASAIWSGVIKLGHVRHGSRLPPCCSVPPPRQATCKGVTIKCAVRGVDSRLDETARTFKVRATLTEGIAGLNGGSGDLLNLLARLALGLRGSTGFLAQNEDRGDLDPAFRQADGERHRRADRGEQDEEIEPGNCQAIGRRIEDAGQQRDQHPGDRSAGQRAEEASRRRRSPAPRLCRNARSCCGLAPSATMTAKLRRRSRTPSASTRPAAHAARTTA